MPKIRLLDRDDRFYVWWHQAVEHNATFRQWADKSYAYYDGDQWSPEEKAELENVNQPAIVINHIRGKINYLVGLAAQQNISIRCTPRGKADSDLAFVASMVLEYIQEINDWRTADIYAFRDAVITGLGWIEARKSLTLFRDPIKIGWVDYREILTDPFAKSPTLDDARFLFRYRWLDEDQAIEMFPEAKRVISEVAGGVRTAPFDTALEYLPGDIVEHWWDRQRRRVLLVELQYKQFEDCLVFWDGMRAQPYRSRYHDKAVRLGKGWVLKMRLPRVRVAFLVGPYVIFDEPSPYLHGRFWYIPYVSYRDRRGIPYGVVRNLIDPQDEINKRRSKALHYLTAKRVLAEEGAVDDPDRFMEELAMPDAFLTYRKGFQVQLENDLQLGKQHFEIMQDAANEMQFISGIFPDAFGQPTNARTGVALQTRTMNSQASLADIFSNRLTALKALGEIELGLAKQFYRPEFVAQIVDENPQNLMADIRTTRTPEGEILLRNDIAALDADIKVEVSSGASERQVALTQLVEVVKSMPPEAAVLMLDMIVDLSDVKDKDQIKARLAPIQHLMLQNLTQPQGGTNANT